MPSSLALSASVIYVVHVPSSLALAASIYVIYVPSSLALSTNVIYVVHVPSSLALAASVVYVVYVPSSLALAASVIYVVYVRFLYGVTDQRAFSRIVLFVKCVFMIVLFYKPMYSPHCGDKGNLHFAGRQILCLHFVVSFLPFRLVPEELRGLGRWLDCGPSTSTQTNRLSDGDYHQVQ